MNQLLFKKFRSKSNLLLLTLFLIAFNFHFANASSNIDDDLNYIGKVEDYDEVRFLFKFFDYFFIF